LARELGIPYKRTGKIVVGFTPEDREKLDEMKAIGEKNGVPGLSIIGKEKIRSLAPCVGGEFAMWSESTAIFDPFEYVLALAQNAHKNGVEFYFNSEVTAVDAVGGAVSDAVGDTVGGAASSTVGDTRSGFIDDAIPGLGVSAHPHSTPPLIFDASMQLRVPIAATAPTSAPVYAVTAGGRVFHTRWVVNCAGLGADKVARMLGCDRYTIFPCRGEYYVLDKKAGPLLPLPAYPVPDPKAGGLGIHLTPTMDGNILVGPSDEYIADPDDYASTRGIMDLLIKDGSRIFPHLSREYFIRNFSGIRPKLAPKEQGGYHDFVVERDDAHPWAVNLIGLESPAMTGALPIAREAIRLMGQIEAFEPSPYFDPMRHGRQAFRDLPWDERAKLIRQDPGDGEIICRCESVTKAEVLEAVRGPLGARTVAGVKYRCRAMMGRCQGGYCQMRISDILMQELGLKREEVLFSAMSGSYMFTGAVRD
jgi:L-2-hydroxyglutarate oxidase LhgO